MKVICAISHALYEPYLSILREGQEQTWLQLPRDSNFQVIHFHGTPVSKMIQKFDRAHEYLRWTNRYIANPLRWVDNFLGLPFTRRIPRAEISTLLRSADPVFHVHQPDLYVTYKWKEVGILKHLLDNFDFDFLFTTTTSSYVLPMALTKVLSTAEPRRFYAGYIPYSGADFASGSNRIFSRDVLELIVKSRGKLKPGIIEDVSIAKLLRSRGIVPASKPTINVSTIEAIESLTDEELQQNYHFRLKSGALNARNDVQLMKLLHSRIIY